MRRASRPAGGGAGGRRRRWLRAGGTARRSLRGWLAVAALLGVLGVGAAAGLAAIIGGGARLAG